jgi:hypothetical protein
MVERRRAVRERQRPTRREQPIRVERGHLHFKGGVFPVSKIAGTQLLKVPMVPERFGAPAFLLEMLRGLSLGLAVTVVGLAAVYISTDAWRDHPEIRTPFLLVSAAIFLPLSGVGLAAHACLNRYPLMDCWYVLDMHVGNRVLEVSSWDIEPLRAIQVDVAAAQNDLNHWGKTIQVNQVIGNGNAANFGGAGNSARSG